MAQVSCNRVFKAESGFVLMNLNCGSGKQGSAVAGGWFAAGKALGMALDLDAGSMLVSVDGAAWTVAFAAQNRPCCPSAAAGAALFPALSGWGGASVRCNWGTDPERPMRHGPPSGEYRPIGLLMEVHPPPAPCLLFTVPLLPRLPCVSAWFQCQCPARVSVVLDFMKAFPQSEF